MRLLRCAVAAAVGTVALAAGTAPETPTRDVLKLERLVMAGPLYRASLHVPPHRRVGIAARRSWGGPITAKSGESVNVTVSAAYPVDDARRRQVADFLSDLLHGPELATVTVYVAPPGEVESLCGLEAFGCYSAHNQLLVAPGEALPDGTSVETVLAHEYGHHVAANRDNAPWRALEWGTKRWASVARVCERAAAGTAWPGDQGAAYPLNPGEAFAETYRLLNYRTLAWPAGSVTEWNVDGSWYPDAEELEAARKDVLEPWRGVTASAWQSRFTVPRRPPATDGRPTKPLAPTTVSRFVAAPRDGTLAVRIERAPRGAKVRVVDPLTSKVVGRPSGMESRGTVCGQRRLKLVLTSPAPGDVAVRIALP